MCGLVGEFLLQKGAEAPDPVVLAAMGETLRHRGPDGADQRVEPGFGLHHRRLAIIDLVTGDQPLEGPGGEQVVVFNGEIYNYLELKIQLEGRGHRFRTRTDTEVLLHGYREWGLDLVGRLRGMFAFALVDRVRQRLLLARDRLGKKPLYLVRLPDRLLFASEAKALLRHPRVDRRLDPSALWEALIFRYVPDPHCIFKGMEKLPPATLLVAECGGSVRQETYWDLSFADPSGAAPEELAAALLESLDEAVRMRLMADVPLGAFLSGGLDSAAVVASMRRFREEVLAVSVGFSDAAFDERPAARSAAARLGVRLEERLTTPDLDVDLPRLADHFDEPFFDSSALPTLHVCAAARRSVTVALSGDGGDEALAGYRRYRFDRQENRVRSLLPGPFRRGVLAPLGRAWPNSPRLPRWLRAGTTLENLGRDPFLAYIHSVSAIAPADAWSMLHPDLREAVAGHDPLAVHAAHFAAAGPVAPLSRVQYLDLKTYLPGDILVKVDRASMAVSLEARAPFLDHVFLERAARVPVGLRIRGGQGKWLLRAALADRLGPESLKRTKQGFSIPLASWIRGELAGRVEAALAEGPCQGLLDRNTLSRWWGEHRGEQRDRSEALWALLVLAEWLPRWGRGAL